MANYLLQVAYTSEAVAALTQHPQNRIEALGPVLSKLGGRFESAYFAFGEYDIVGIVDVPGNVEAAALSMAVTAGGAVKAIKTTPLMSVAEGVAALTKASTLGYVPPTGAAV
jgi:uncharacterized protein with GYD domain